jgi:hypothetical protein
MGGAMGVVNVEALHEENATPATGGRAKATATAKARARANVVGMIKGVMMMMMMMMMMRKMVRRRRMMRMRRKRRTVMPMRFGCRVGVRSTEGRAGSHDC